MIGLPAWLPQRQALFNTAHKFGDRVRRRQKNYLSPLTLRIMVVNLLSLAILVGTILYLGRYQDRIIEVEAQALLSQARIFAGAIAEGATVQADEGNDHLLPPLARQMVRRLDEVTDARTRLYDNTGKQMADSWVIGRIARARVGAQALPDLMDNHFLQHITGMGVHLIQTLTPGRRVWPLYDERGALNGLGQRREVQEALNGNEASEVYMGPDGHLLFSVAAPVQRYKQALGVLNLTRSGEQVELAIRTVRTDILKVFFGALAITILLSFYLARAIVIPIRRLASAADAVRSGQMKAQLGAPSNAMRRREIPDFSGRHDEIGDLSGALRAMTATLWQRMDAIESFAADVSHELKNPLASLRSAIETLGRVQNPGSQEKLHSIIEYDVVRLDRLITDIAGASRLDAELSRIELERIDIAQLLSTLADIYAYQKGAQGRVLLGEIKGPLFVAGFEGRLVQVFQNIITNALSFSPPLNGDKGTVRIGAVRLGNLVQITIDDDGPGIPDAKLGAIFDRFYTERPASEAFGQHSGLGLSISQQIIQAHRGTIRATNRLDAAGQIEGARFTVELPAL